MAMWRLKSCPNCGGDMFIERDLYGWYEKCPPYKYDSGISAAAILGPLKLLKQEVLYEIL